MKRLIVMGVLLAGLSPAARLWAQGGKQLVIEQSDELSYSGSAGVRALKGNVRLRHNQTILYCDSALMFDGGEQARAYGRVRIVEPGESLVVRCRYLEFDARTESARLYQDVQLTDDVMQLLAPELNYNTARREVTFSQGARIEDGNARLSSRLGRYEVESGEMHFARDVRLTEDSMRLTTDSLRYNRRLGRMYFVAPTDIVNPDSRAATTGGWYDLRSRVGHLYPYCTVVHADRHYLWADSLYFNQNRGSGWASGRVQWVDTVQGMEIRAGFLQFDRSTGRYQAWDHPLIRTFGQAGGGDTAARQPSVEEAGAADTLSLTADTLLALRVWNGTGIRPHDSVSPYTSPSPSPATPGDSSWTFTAWGQVAGQNADGWLRCDSLVYREADSLALLMGTPLLWPASFQLSGPFMRFMRNRGNSGQLELPEGGVVAEQLPDSLFHQIAASQMRVEFDSGAIHYLHAVGEVLTLYHVPDEDSGFVGVNRVAADSLDMYFSQQRPSRMVFHGKPEGVLWPPRQVPEGEDTVRGFRWQGLQKQQAQARMRDSMLKNPDRGGYGLFPRRPKSTTPGLMEERTPRRRGRRR